MDSPTEKKSLREKVLASIAQGGVTMRPRWYFVLQAGLIIAGSCLVTLTLLYLSSFIFFWLGRNGVWFAPSFGLFGLRTFFISLPWILLLVIGVFIILLEILFKHFAFTYRRPMVYSILFILVLVVFGGLAIAQTPFHERVFQFSRRQHPPFLAPMYHTYGQKWSEGVQSGTIMEKTEKGFTMKTRDEESLEVIITPETRFPYGTDFAPGDRVVILGHKKDTTIQALGIRDIDQNTMGPALQGRPRRFSPLYREPMMPNQE